MKKLKYMKTFEYYYFDVDIDDIKVGQNVKYKNVEYNVIENTGEVISLKPVDDEHGEIVKVYHYNAHNIKTEW
jgi:hypothetical protein